MYTLAPPHQYPQLPGQPARDTMGRGTSAGEGERGGAGRGEVLERQKPLALGLARTRFGATHEAINTYVCVMAGVARCDLSVRTRWWARTASQRKFEPNKFVADGGRTRTTQERSTEK